MLLFMRELLGEESSPVLTRHIRNLLQKSISHFGVEELAWPGEGHDINCSQRCLDKLENQMVSRDTSAKDH